MQGMVLPWGAERLFLEYFLVLMQRGQMGKVGKEDE